MSLSTEKRPSFWKELKRRGVPRVMAMYAATAFIIMEAGDIMLPRLGLPDWTVTLVIVLLIVGLPLAFILSWIFDITPHGVVKTGPLEEEVQDMEPEETHRRKLRVSDGVIGVLLIFVAVLVYPKIFGAGNSSLPREMKGKISIAVMPFKNMTGDSIYNLWQEGLQNLVITALSNSEELAVRQFETMNHLIKKDAGVNYASLTPSLINDMARKVEANTVISGNMHKSGTTFRLTANIMNADTEEIYKSYEMEGNAEDELFKLADSLSLAIRNFLEIKKIRQSVDFDLAYAYTNSAEAYKYYLQGLMCHGYLDYTCAAENYNKAIQVDSNFVSAMMKLAYCYADIRQAELSKKWAYEAYNRMEKLPPEMQLMVRAVKAVADKKPLEQLDYAKRYLDLYPHSTYMTYMVAWINFNLHQWEASIEGFELNMDLLAKIDDHPWAWTYILLGGAYHEIGSHKKEQKIFEEGISHWPEQKSTFYYWMAICSVSQGDATRTAFYLKEIRKMKEQSGWPEANILLWYAGIYAKGGSLQKAEEYYHLAIALKPGNQYALYDFVEFLINNDIHREEAQNIIVPLMEQYPDKASYLYSYGKLLYNQGRLRKADEVLQKSWDLKSYYDHEHFTITKKLRDQLAAQ